MLIQNSQKGDKQAFGLLVRKNMKRAYYIALGLVGTHENALDLSQEAFIRAFRSIKKMDSSRKFFTWYYQILRNLCFNFLRDQNRHASSFSEIGENRAGSRPVENIIDQSQDISKNQERHELKEIFWKAMNLLKAPEREIIILKNFQEMSYKEIAEVLKCPVGTVMSRLYTARKSLKNLLEGYYYE